MLPSRADSFKAGRTDDMEGKLGTVNTEGAPNVENMDEKPALTFPTALTTPERVALIRLSTRFDSAGWKGAEAAP